MVKRCEVCRKPATHIRKSAADLCDDCYRLERKQIRATKSHEKRVKAAA